MGREIQQLRQEIFQLKQASSSNPSTQKSIDSNFGNEPKISLLEKFDGTRSKFRGFLQQVKLFLRLHPLRYPNGATQVGFIGALLSGNALSWFAPLMEKNSPLLDDLDKFIEVFTSTFGDSDRERVAETKIQNLRQGLRSAAIYAVEFQQLTCDFDWNDKAFIN